MFKPALDGVAQWIERWPVPFRVRAPAWVVGQVLSRGRARGNHTLMFPSLSPSLPLCLKINNIFKRNVKAKYRALCPWGAKVKERGDMELRFLMLPIALNFSLCQMNSRSRKTSSLGCWNHFPVAYESEEVIEESFPSAKPLPCTYSLTSLRMRMMLAVSSSVLSLSLSKS